MSLGVSYGDIDPLGSSKKEEEERLFTQRFLKSPGMFYFGFATLYLFAKLIIWGLSKDGYPSLKVLHRAAILLMPFYGFPIFIAIWLPIRKIIFKD
jgi:cytochrome c biogenesis protein CcdA